MANKINNMFEIIGIALAIGLPFLLVMYIVYLIIKKQNQPWDI